MWFSQEVLLCEKGSTGEASSKGTMLATSEFWFEPPLSEDQAWDPVLSVYNECDPWPAK